MDMPKIVAMFRLKNEERWIEKSLKHASSICEEIVVLDDGSTDDTVKICKSFENVVDIHQQNGVPFDDSRDKNTLLKMALKRKPDFILTLDGDQILQHNAKEILLEEINVLYPDSAVFEFQQLLIWDKPNQYRYDGILGYTWIKKLVRISKQPKDLHFEGTDYPGNAHCPHIPQNVVGSSNSVRSKMKIFHYGYYDEKLRQKKYNYYMKTQPSPVEFDNYKHMLSGKGSKFSISDGLEFRTLPEGTYIKDIR